MNTATEIVDAARLLAPEQRLWLIDQIWNSLPPEQWSTSPAPQVRDVPNHYASCDSCEETASSWEEVRGRLPVQRFSGG